MRQVFDIRTSQPAALRCLAAEMESGREPVVHRLLGRDMLAFRSHERALTGRSASLVGQERRRRAWQEEIDTLAREVTRAGKEVARLERQRRREEKNLTLLNRHKEALAALLVDIRAQASRLASARQELDHCRESEQRLRNRHDRLQTEAGELRDHCRQLAEQIAAQGLAGLEKKVRGLQRKVERNQKGISEREREIGAIDARLDQTGREQERLEQHGQELARQLGEAEAVLAARLPEVDDLARYVLKTKTGHQFASIEAVLDKRARAEDNIRELVPEIRLKIRDPRFGAAFRFTHEGETNKVFDFRARPPVR
jgi:chromosome segregation ATPase